MKKGDEVHLSCLYDLGLNNSLYALKWFYRAQTQPEKEEKEIFRFTPRGKPIKQYFPLPGIKVDVSLSGR